MQVFNNLADQQAILKRQDLSPTEKFVALVLLSFRNAETGRCNPAVFSDNPEKETICTRSGYTKPCIVKTIASLEKKGILSIQKNVARPSDITFTVNNDYRKQDLPLTTFTPTVNGVNPYSKRGLPITNKEQINEQIKNINNDASLKNHENGFSLEPSEQSKPKRRQPLQKPTSVTQQTWDDFNALRKAKRAPLTTTALSRIEKEAQKADIDLETALQVCCERGWQGFRADWYQNTVTSYGQKNSYKGKIAEPEDWNKDYGVTRPM